MHSTLSSPPRSPIELFPPGTDYFSALGLPAIHRAQAGLMADMDQVCDVLYARTEKRVAVPA